jgi:hypothetical protein
LPILYSRYFYFYRLFGLPQNWLIIPKSLPF